MELLQAWPAVAYAAAALLGLVVGSFLNVVILRQPPRWLALTRAEAREWLALPADPADPIPPSYVSTPSACFRCGTPLRWYHNVPLLGFAVLRGRSACCRQPISWQYPLVEAASALLVMACLWRFGIGLQFAAACLFVWLLLVMTVIDLRTQLLPDQLTQPLLWLGLLLSPWQVFVTPEAAILGAAAGWGLLWGTAWLFRVITGRDGLGGGDPKLLAALGAWLGWTQLPLLLLLSSVVGSVAGLVYLAIRKRSLEFAFGPYLALAGVVALFGGEAIARWYLLRG